MSDLGFGYLRFPYRGEEIDYGVLNTMVDEFLARGGRYFDTAYNYLDGKSEDAIRETLVKRYPRDSFQLATKLPGYSVSSYEECFTYFETSARRCGVDYFDVYMLHWLNAGHYRLAEQYREFEFLQELKRTGKAKRIGFSFHDTAALLDEILTAHPEVDCVLLQINYLDWESPGIQSRLCYETALKHGKSVMVMEPVKGGRLAMVPPEAEAILRQIDPDASTASHGIRFARGLPGVEMVLSGMNSLAQMEENLRQTRPMAQWELDKLQQAAAVIRAATPVPCTGCGYCLKHCPMEIAISQCFALYNEAAIYPRHLWKITPAYEALKGNKAAACLQCRSCESHCPQKLPIPEHLRSVAEKFQGQE